MKQNINKTRREREAAEEFIRRLYKEICTGTQTAREPPAKR